MLKLTDGTELTEEIREAFKHGIVKSYIKLTDGTIINQDNYLQSIKLEELRFNEDTEQFIGEAVARRTTITIYNEDNAIDLEDKEFELFFGAELQDKTTAWINFGNFIVQKPDNNDTEETSDFEALDYMCKTNVTYKCNVTFPCTYKDIAEDVCSQCGLELGSESFRNSDKIVTDNPFINDEQCRFVIKEIAKIAFSWARIGTDNKLYFDFNIKNENDIAEEYSLDDYIELEKNNETIPVNTIILRASNIEGENVTIKDDNLIAEYGVQKELVIEEDYFAYTEELRKELIEAGRELFGLTYTPITISLIGTIYLESNDIISITDKNGNKRYSYCLNHTIDYDGTLYDSIENPALTETETSYQHESDEDLSKRRTEAIVDKANQKIELVVEQIGDRSQKSTTITEDIDGINSKVEDLEDLTRDVTGLKKVEISSAMTGNLLELHIYGNNTVFDSTYVSEDTYVSDDTILMGDSTILVHSQDLKDKFEKQYGYFYINVKVLYNYNNGKYDITGYRISTIKDSNRNRFYIMPLEYGKTYTIILDKNEISDTKWLYMGTFTENPLENEEDSEIVGINYYGINEAEFDYENNKWNWYTDTDKTYITITPTEEEKYLIFYSYTASTFETAQMYENYQEIDLGIDEVLRAIEDVKDEYVYTYDTDTEKITSKVIRRIGIADNIPYILNEETTEELDTFNINLLEDETNTIEILNYYAQILAKYVVKNNLTSQFVTKVKFDTQIKQTSQEIELLAKETVRDDEIIARINMAILGKDDTDIPDDIEKSIIEILANKISIKSDNFELTKDGIITAIAGKIAGLVMSKVGSNSFLYKRTTDETYESGLMIPDSIGSTGQTAFIYAGTGGGETPYLAKTWISHQGNMYFRSGALYMIYEPTKNDDGSYSWQSAMEMFSNGTHRYLSNGNHWTYEGIGYIDNIANNHSIFLYDALSYNIIDGSHDNDYILRVFRVDNDGNSAVIKAFTDFYANNIYSNNFPVICSFPTESDYYNIDYIFGQTVSGSLKVCLKIAGTYYYLTPSTSDEKLKENIQTTQIDNALDIINKIEHFEFNWKSDGTFQKIGYIANKMQEVEKDFVDEIEQDNETTSLQINTFKMLPYITKSIQELNKKVEKQQKIIDFLAEKLNCKDELEEYLKNI